MSKDEQITTYAVNMFIRLEEAGVYLKTEEQKAFVAKYLGSDEPMEDIIARMLRDARQLRGSHDRRNKLEHQLHEEEGQKLALQRKTANSGFASIIAVAIVVGGFLGILLAFALLNIK